MTKQLHLSEATHITDFYTNKPETEYIQTSDNGNLMELYVKNSASQVVWIAIYRNKN